jgi:hypothetical protein
MRLGHFHGRLVPAGYKFKIASSQMRFIKLVYQGHFGVLINDGSVNEEIT